MLLQAGRNHEIDLAHRGIACFAHQKTEPKQKISLIVIKWLGTTKIYLHSKGDEFSASEFSDDQTDLREAYLHLDAEDLIRGMIIKAFHEKLSFSYHNEKNCIRVIEKLILRTLHSGRRNHCQYPDATIPVAGDYKQHKRVPIRPNQLRQQRIR